MDAETLRTLLSAKASELLARAAERAADPKTQHSAAALAGHAQALLAAADVALLHFPLEEDGVLRAEKAVFEGALAWWWATRDEPRPNEGPLAELAGAIAVWRELPSSNDTMCRIAQEALAREHGTSDA